MQRQHTHHKIISIINTKKKVLIIASILILILFIFKVFYNKPVRLQDNFPIISKNTQTAPDNFKSIIPGKTTEQEVYKILGNPITKKEVESDFGQNYLSLDYPSENENFPNGIGIRNGIVNLIGINRSTEKISLKKTLEKYGKPDKITYSYLDRSYRTFIYSKKGLMFIGNYEEDFINFTQYFSSMPLDEYMKTWGKDLPLNDWFRK